LPDRRDKCSLIEKRLMLTSHSVVIIIDIDEGVADADVSTANNDRSVAFAGAALEGVFPIHIG
jgi:hypothetical protein